MRTLVTVLCLPLLSGCSLLGLRKHIESLEQQGGIAVQVSPPPKGRAPTYAAAWTLENGKRKDSAGFQELRPDGFAAFSLKMDRVYNVGAFTDENGNGKYDVGEPLGFVRDVKPLALVDPTVKARVLKLTLKRESDLPRGTVIEIPKENKDLGGKTNLALGDVVSLDEPRFAEEEGAGGLWRPLDFLSQNTLGIYFTEPYDPKRTPVLFVYGIGGSPQDGRHLIEHLDRKKYQFWFYHYPSGMRLDRVASMMATGLNILKQRLGFKKCDVVAHSMGGLVSREGIIEAVKLAGVNFIPEFVSISTPWGGHKAAESGIRHLKKPVPSWLDVAPNSSFLLDLYHTPLPKGTTHDIIYGSIDGGPFWMNEKNDGVVTVASETDPRIAAHAASVTYFPYGHVPILSSDETTKKVGALLLK